jgi:demethylmenaquinone methyltransferase/2-methoxy-6-polyprenyl-1,4-benzoquinol methylase
MPTPATSRDAPREPAWSPETLADDPHRRDDKSERVRAMFAAIAERYDLNNRLHSFGLDQRWRRRVVRAAQVDATTVVVDVACGTGDLSEAFAAAGVARVIGIDYTPQMLDIARTKASRRGERGSLAGRIEYREGDAMNLDLPDGFCDVLSIAFGIRNVADPARAFSEFHRVLRPGGRLLVLEFSEPRNRVLRALNALYTRRIMPWTASLIARDRSGAYRYLPKSIATFLSPEGLARLARTAGFVDIRAIPLTFGVCTVTVASKKPL